jgi:hypothetical protein
MAGPSICIPRMFVGISRKKIEQVFNGLKLGSIDYIDIHLGKEYQKVYVFFKAWRNTAFADSIKKRFVDGEQLKIIYDDPWFWKCSLNRLRGGGERNQRQYVSKYNTRNQLLAMKKLLAEQRDEFARLLEEKDREIKRLSTYISACMGDDMLLKRKREAQGKRGHRYLFCKSAGVLFS